MKLASKLWVVFLATTLVACAGYQPINKNFDDFTTAEIYVQSVEVQSPERRVGTRLNAQYMKQLLTRRFTGAENAPLRLIVRLTEAEQSVSFRIDATAERSLLTMDSVAYVHNQEGRVLATIETRTDAAYEIQASPFATAANYDQARQSAIENMQRDLQRQLNLFLRDHQKSKN